MKTSLKRLVSVLLALMVAGFALLSPELVHGASVPEFVGPYRIKVNPDDLSADKTLTDDWMHILLMGTDGKSPELNRGRSDAMMILSVDRKTKEIKLTSLVRDMLVRIPLVPGLKDRINTANAYGGPLLAVKTVNELLQLNITRYASVNYESFIEIVDRMGGIDMELSAAEAYLSGADHRDGIQHLNGRQTLDYARIRRLDNNFGRNERQRKVMEALYGRFRETSPGKALSTLGFIYSRTASNLSFGDCLFLFDAALRGRGEIQMLSLPPDHNYVYARTNEGASVIRFNEERIREIFDEFMFGKARKAK